MGQGARSARVSDAVGALDVPTRKRMITGYGGGGTDWRRSDQVCGFLRGHAGLSRAIGVGLVVRGRGQPALPRCSDPVGPGDMMMDWLPPASGGAAAQSVEAVRGGPV